MRTQTYGKGKCIDCPKTMIRNSPNHVRCKKCADTYRNSTQPERDTLLLTSADEPKRTWGKRMPDTISRSQIVRRNRAEKIKKGRYKIKHKYGRR